VAVKLLSVSGNLFLKGKTKMSKQWEYLVMSLTQESGAYNEGILDLRGTEGWELVSVSDCVAYMKREKKAESQEHAFPTINDPWAAKAVEKVVAQEEVMQ
jgi:hypothetical protein